MRCTLDHCVLEHRHLHRPPGPQHIEVKVRIIYGVTQSGEVTGEGPIWAVATRLQEMDVYVLESLSKRTFDLCTSNINKVYSRI